MRSLGINMSNVKQVNRSHVLWLLITEGATSRTDLANRLHLTTATLTSICSDFIGKGILIEEGKEASSSLGRKKSLLSINPAYKYVISVNIHYTGNTIAKLAAGITDTAVTMAAKAHLRNGRPVVIAMASNDGLAAGARNIGELLVRKNYYFVPFGQDNAQAKPSSLVADFSKIPETVDAALRGEQIQPVLLR